MIIIECQPPKSIKNQKNKEKKYMRHVTNIWCYVNFNFYWKFIKKI